MRKFCAKLSFFEILNRIRFIFFFNFKRNRKFRNFEPKSIFFLKCWQKSRFWKLKIRNRIFLRKCWPKSKFLQFWNEIEIYPKMFTEIEIFEILNEMKFVRKCWQKSRFSNFLTEIEFYFRKCWPKSRFSKFGAKSNFFS